MTEWFDQWFGEAYLRLYPHRDDRDAERVVSLIETILPLPGLRVLDLGCGPGRHAAQFHQRGARVVGFDRSMPLLSRAHHRLTDAGLQVVRGDMRRLPFRQGSFDLVVNLFTSFGYFTDDRQHRIMLHEAADLLRPGGTFVLDYLHAGAVRATLVAREEQQVGTQRVAIARSITDGGRFVVKEIHMVHDGRSFIERVRLFDPEELAVLLADAGLTVTRRFGGYDGGAITPSADRAILVAEKQ